MKAIVTGGAGFIGSHIVDVLLERGHKPFVIDNLSTGSEKNVPNTVPLYQMDIRNPAAIFSVFNQVQPECVFHLAGQTSVSYSMKQPAVDAVTNIMGLLAVLECARHCGTKRFIFASSGGVLYGEPPRIPVDEEVDLQPMSPYGISKWTGEQYLAFYARERRFERSVALRYANVYGPRQNPNGESGVVAIVAQKMLNGEPVTIHGDGHCIRDYVYVTDAALASVLAAEHPNVPYLIPFNVGTGIGTTVNEIVVQISNCVGTRAPRMIPTKYGPPRAGDLKSNVIDPARAKRLLGWEPKTPLSVGLPLTVDWFVQQNK